MPGSLENKSVNGKQRTSYFASFLIKGDVDCPTIDIDGNGSLTLCCTDQFTSGTQFNAQLGKYWGSRNLVGIIVSYSHPKFRPLPHGNKSIGGVGSHRASL